MSAAPSRAVFLSYASQDADAARKICDALRGAGVEVWFDQSELVGGDAWDAKIRKQIAECALFVPILSANTQARLEGYFRIEWKLAAQRTHAMADEKAFLLPVVIDDTRDADAKVPVEFKAVQWTRLHQAYGGQARQVQGGEPGEDASVAAFCVRVKALVDGELGARSPSAAAASEMRPGAAALPRGNRRWWVPAAIAAAALGTLGIWSSGFLNPKPITQNPKSTAGSGDAGGRPAPAPGPAATAISPAREWVAKARALFEPWDLATQEDFQQAEQFLKRAIELDPSDGEAWAAQTLVSIGCLLLGHDESAARLNSIRMQAERAVKLAPASDYARFAQAYSMRLDAATRPEAIRVLRELVARQPQDRFMLRTLGAGLGKQAGTEEEGLALLARAAALPGGDPIAEYISAEVLGRFLNRQDDALAAIDRAVALAPNHAEAYVEKLMIHLERRADAKAARAAVASIPTAVLRQDRMAAMAIKVLFATNEPDQVLRVLAATSAYFETGQFKGPAAYWKGLAHRRAGRLPAAQAEWRIAMRAVQARLDANPGAIRELRWKACLHALLEERAEATTAFDLYKQLVRGTPITPEDGLHAQEIGCLVNPQEAMARAAQTLATESRFRPKLAASVLFNPIFDHVRDDPAFVALVAQAQAYYAGVAAKGPR